MTIGTMDYTEIYLIRHGETTWNVERRWQGQKDSPLSENGVAQAAAIGQRLAGVDLNEIYASDLLRTAETARQIATHHPLEVIHDARLRERKGGILEGLTGAEVKEQHPEIAKKMEGGWPPDFAPPGAESAIDLLDRCNSVLVDLAREHAGERIAVVSHGGLMRVFLQNVLGVPLDRPFAMPIGNTSLNILHYGNFRHGPWRAITLGDTAHIQP